MQILFHHILDRGIHSSLIKVARVGCISQEFPRFPGVSVSLSSLISLQLPITLCSRPCYTYLSCSSEWKPLCHALFRLSSHRKLTNKLEHDIEEGGTYRIHKHRVEWRNGRREAATHSDCRFCKTIEITSNKSFRITIEEHSFSQSINLRW